LGPPPKLPLPPEGLLRDQVEGPLVDPKPPLDADLPPKLALPWPLLRPEEKEARPPPLDALLPKERVEKERLPADLLPPRLKFPVLRPMVTSFIHTTLSYPRKRRLRRSSDIKLAVPSCKTNPKHFVPPITCRTKRIPRAVF